MIHPIDIVFVNAPVAKVKQTLNNTRGMSDIYRENQVIIRLFDTITGEIKRYLVSKMTLYHYGIK